MRIGGDPSTGSTIRWVAKMFGADPKSEMDEDLLRLKTALEKGKLPRDAAKPVAT